MCLIPSVRALALVAAVCLSAVACSREDPPDLILVNGNVLTADASRPTVEALAVRGEFIIAVGATADIEALARAQTRRIDLQGRTVVPGFNDAHAHFSVDPEGQHLSFATMEPSWDEVRGAITRTAAKAPAGTWIYGVVGHSVVLDERVTRAALDRVAPAHPVLLRAYYGHGYILNTAAMRSLVIKDDEPDPFGGHFERVKGSNRINGRVWEYAAWNLDRLLGQRVTDEEAIAAMRAMAQEALGFGITSLQLMPASMSIDRFVELLVKAELPVRVRAIPFALTEVGRRHRSETRRAPFLKYPTSNVTVSGIKWVLDGTPYERGAALRGDYADKPGARGALNFPEAEVGVMVREAVDIDQPLLFHVAGDRSAALVIDTLENHRAVGDWPARRVRLEHGDGVIADLIPRARALGLIVVQNPSHFSDAALFHARWGTGMQPLRSLIEAGIPVAIGSDGPLNPGLNIMLATLHPSSPGEAITREQALRAYTTVSAFAEQTENVKGTLTAGKVADLAVLSHDIMTVPPPELPKTRSVLTIVGGKIVFDANAIR